MENQGVRYARCYTGSVTVDRSELCCPVSVASQVTQNSLFSTLVIPGDVGCPFAAWPEQREARWGVEFTLCGPAVASLFLQKENIRMFSDLLNHLRKLRVPLLLSLIFIFFSMKLKISENLTTTYLFLESDHVSQNFCFWHCCGTDAFINGGWLVKLGF